MTMDELLNMGGAQRAAAAAAISDADLIALADPRSERPVKTRKRALAVIAAEAEMYAAFAQAGTH